MTDDQLLRYSRHLLLNEIGVEGQEKILHARVLIIGVGGLGSPAVLYLASAGVGHISLVDGDTVELTNLQRQIAHNMADIGINKAYSALEKIAKINPTTQISIVSERATAAMLSRLVAQADVVLDCCDNFATRHAINAACVEHGKPLVSGAAVRFDGQISVYDPRVADAPCYACVFPPKAAVEDISCANLGIFAPVVGMIGSMQAAEALKLICGVGEPLTSRLLMLDARDMSWNDVRLKRDPHCAVCGKNHAHA